MTNGNNHHVADFTGEAAEAGTDAGASTAGLSLPPTKAYDPAPEREGIRGKLAIFLLLLLMGVVLVSFASLWFLNKEGFENLKALLELLLAPIVALVGTVTGFYFGEKTKS